jgi:hypothetical protein
MSFGEKWLISRENFCWLEKEMWWHTSVHDIIGTWCDDTISSVLPSRAPPLF